MARRRRKSSGGSSVAAVLGILGLVVFIGAAIAVFTLLKLKAGEATQLDADLCPVDGPRSVTAVLLDVTDPISDITKIDLKRQFQKAVAEVEPGGLIEVYALTSEEGKLKKTFAGCNPGDGEHADVWTTNPKKIQERWRKGFDDPLKEVERGIGEDTAATSSPIMAGIQRIVIESLNSLASEGKSKTLYVASDMIEHTSSFSIYKSGADYGKFENSAAQDRFRTPLDGIAVQFLVFQRDTNKPIAELPEFWGTWVVANGGEVTGYKRLTGIE